MKKKINIHKRLIYILNIKLTTIVKEKIINVKNN